MGWLEGVLTGYADRHYKILGEKRLDAELAARREEQVLNTLLSSKYPEIRDYAAAGMLDLSNPRKRSGGVAGWMGEMDKSPYLEMVRRAKAQIEGDPEYARHQLYGAPPTPSIPSPAGSVENQEPSAALPSTSLVTGGPAPAPTPAPPPPPPGAMPNVSFGAAPGVTPAAQGFARPKASFRPGATAPTGGTAPAGVPAPAPAGPAPQIPYTGTTISSTPDGKVIGVVNGQPVELTPDGRFILGVAQAPPPEAAAPGAAPAEAAPPPVFPASPNVSFAPPPPTPGVQAAQAEGAAPPQAGPPMAPAGPPPPPAGPPLTVSSAPPRPPGQVAVGNPGAAVNQVGRLPPPRSARTQLPLPGIFPTAADLQQDQSRATVMGKIDAYTEMYKAQGMSDEDAYRMAAELLERDLVGSSGNPYMSIRGEYTDANGQVIRTPVTFDKTTKRYFLPDGSPAPASLRLVTTGALRQSMEQVAASMGYPSAKAVPQHLWPAMEQKALELDAQVAQNRTEAGMDARAFGTLSPADAMAFGVGLGTQGRNIVGQRLPTPLDLQRRRSLGALQDEVERIIPLVNAALVSEQDLGGMFPNAANAALARSTRRNEFAALDQAVQSIVNTLARAIADQKGAQTEQDAKRAEAALASFNSGIKGLFTDPLGGDTIESAMIRLQGTLGTIKMVLAQTPGAPKVQSPIVVPPPTGSEPPPATPDAPPGTTPTPDPGAVLGLAPPGAPLGWDKGIYKSPPAPAGNGKRYWNGKEY